MLRSLPMIAPLLLSLQLATTAAEWKCPVTFSNGPCFTKATTWREAQATCEAHGSNLATVQDVAVRQLHI